MMNQRLNSDEQSFAWQQQQQQQFAVHQQSQYASTSTTSAQQQQQPPPPPIGMLSSIEQNAIAKLMSRTIDARKQTSLFAAEIERHNEVARRLAAETDTLERELRDIDMTSGPYVISQLAVDRCVCA
jgi:hypothetical protein